MGKILVLDLQQNSGKTLENVLKLIHLLIKSGFVERKCVIGPTVVVLRDIVKKRWWSATDIKHRKHVKTCYLRDRVSLGFRDRVRVRVKDRVSFRLATFMYSVCFPVPHFPYAKPQKF